MAKPVISAVVSRAHMLRSSLHSNWTNFKSLHNNHTNLYDCRRNKFYMIADVTNFAWLQKNTNFNTRWKHDNSSNKQLLMKSTSLVNSTMCTGNGTCDVWRLAMIGMVMFFFFSAHSQVVFIQLVNRGIYSNQHIVKKLLRQRLWWWYIDSRRDLCK